MRLAKNDIIRRNPILGKIPNKLAYRVKLFADPINIDMALSSYRNKSLKLRY